MNFQDKRLRIYHWGRYYFRCRGIPRHIKYYGPE